MDSHKVTVAVSQALKDMAGSPTLGQGKDSRVLPASLGKHVVVAGVVPILVSD